MPLRGAACSHFLVFSGCIPAADSAQRHGEPHLSKRFWTKICACCCLPGNGELCPQRKAAALKGPGAAEGTCAGVRELQSWVQRVKEGVTGGLDKTPTRLLSGFTDTTGSQESELVEMKHMHLAETLITHRNEGGDSVSFCHALQAG